MAGTALTQSVRGRMRTGEAFARSATMAYVVQAPNREASGPAETGQRQRRAGRPRLRPASGAEVAPRAEILDAAAELFVSQGIAATTTRQIAERVGIRQASLYYYFAGKDEILLELLTQSVRPSLRVAGELESRCRGNPAAGLYALALIDVATLTLAPHNIATLYLMPEVQAEKFAPFRAERAQLQAVYGRLGQAASAGHVMEEGLTATLLMQLVESVIQLRRTGELHDGYDHEIAAACLRLVGLDRSHVASARAAADGLTSPEQAAWSAGIGGQ